MDPPACNHANSYNADFEKRLPLYTPEENKQPSNSTAFEAIGEKKAIGTESSGLNASQDGFLSA
ncbi:hypothetical protein SPOG_03776 [Schizosaccharomyces cryophilus OY26]|uniref:Uncharacterized protein n=1 Tax=Schizosaccharomyces cryophilus (strain OY26 / ATCC MYA-4695 / CBS 11777 / NBRC 106824 / NRRL Y48691) TaxID=653667 RepID=S9W5I6_SCHCR|nr:uncharacterized protein SPOG_03776 [Schizosaccharomyces cryophilus OY26]EPY53245.1 hypothetical protein SPOG_03776 [Schizosaccharomyces cryophilus OY26]